MWPRGSRLFGISPAAQQGMVLALALLVGPAFDTIFHFAVMPYNHSEFDSHGDLRRNLLDEVEQEELKRDEPQIAQTPAD